MSDARYFKVGIRDLNERGQGVGSVTAVFEGTDENSKYTDLVPNQEHTKHYQGKVCFVDGALPGEEVLAILRQDRRHYLVLDLVEILKASPDRELSDCDYFPECGSCQLRHIDYKAELRLKDKRVRDLLCRVGPLDIEAPETEKEASHLTSRTDPPSQSDIPPPDDHPVFRPIIGMEDPCHYRSKSIFPIAEIMTDREDRSVAIGQYRRGTHDLIDLHHCKIQSEVALALVNTIRDLIVHDEPSIYDEAAHSGTLRHLVVRVGFSSNQVMVIFVVNDDLEDSSIESWIPELRQTVHAQAMTLTSVWLNNMDTKGNRILSSDYRLLDGEEAIEETINGVSYKISPDSFFQVNPRQSAVLFKYVIDAADLNPSDRILDLYCGVGALGLQLAAAMGPDGPGEVIGVDNVPQAIEDARENARLNAMPRLQFIEADATAWLVDYMDNPADRPFDVIVVDPPRKGLDPDAVEAIKNSNSPRVIYVSCNPATLARDLSILHDTYQIVNVQPVDMFPRTMHVETVVLMSRVDK
ncbi:MAG TPA: 23S rRNA (uracil(1939)-C(5))-methyltransferase RlmD [Clostridia bacterium]|nr:23S rRNA (uracil(1939)-C(5))-methyltransferase RlmD [Clostridia bacterium]